MIKTLLLHPIQSYRGFISKIGLEAVGWEFLEKELPIRNFRSIHMVVPEEETPFIKEQLIGIYCIYHLDFTGPLTSQVLNKKDLMKQKGEKKLLARNKRSGATCYLINAEVV